MKQKGLKRTSLQGLRINKLYIFTRLPQKQTTKAGISQAFFYFKYRIHIFILLEKIHRSPNRVL